jgi:hypothetical protein
MIARIVTLMIIVVLALPVATLTRPAETSHSPWGDVAVAAKGKKHHGHHHKKHRKHTKHTQRETVTQTFTSTQPITTPHGAPTSDKGPANPYPSAIAVSGLRHGTITDVNLILTDLTHDHYDDLDILLSTSDGRQALVMSDVGDIPDVVGEDIDLILDDEAAASMPGENEYVRSGTFRPTNIDGFNGDTFDAPAPAPNGDVALSTFDGADPNGTWQLWVMDNAAGDYGDLGSWALQITAEVDE